MKQVRRLFAFALTLVMAFAMCATAFAVETNTATQDEYKVDATINNVKSGNTVNFYRIVDFNLDADTNGFSYTLAQGLPTAYNTIDKLAAITSDDYVFTDGSAAKAAADTLANAIAGGSLTPIATITQASSDNSATKSLPAGWYVVTVSGTEDTSIIYQNMIINALPVVDSANNTYKKADNVVFDVKHTDETITKNVPDNGADAKTSDDYSIGDTVEGFKITTAIPNYPNPSKEASFVITDTPVHMNDVLTSVEVTVDNEKVEDPAGKFTVAATAATSTTGAGFTITFVKDYILAHPGESVVVTYNATIDTDAAIANDGETASNTAKITFNPNPNESTTVEPDDTTKLYTYGLNVLKHEDGDEKTYLPGAKFILYAEDGTTSVKPETEVNDKGQLTWDGLKEGTYKLVETVAPAGYRLDSTPRPITLNARTAQGDDPLTEGTQSYVLQSKVPNTPGSTLPSTGGIGTTIFYIVGGVMVAGAAIFLLTKRRVAGNE